MKKTALYNKHIESGAKMVPFAGYEMPVQYDGVNVEHKCVRLNAGIFDVSHMGEFIVSGKNAFALIQKFQVMMQLFYSLVEPSMPICLMKVEELLTI